MIGAIISCQCYPAMIKSLKHYLELNDKFNVLTFLLKIKFSKSTCWVLNCEWEMSSALMSLQASTTTLCTKVQYSHEYSAAEDIWGHWDAYKKAWCAVIPDNSCIHKVDALEPCAKTTFLYIVYYFSNFNVNFYKKGLHFLNVNIDLICCTL